VTGDTRPAATVTRLEGAVINQGEVATRPPEEGTKLLALVINRSDQVIKWATSRRSVINWGNPP